MHTDVLIIGAGISGITLARTLTAAGRQCVVVDKGRGVGGRMSTRRRDDLRFDHGAQFITVRDQRVQRIFDDLVSDGIAREWFRADGIPRYCGTQGMSRIVSALAEGCDVRTDTEVQSVAHDGTLWTITCTNGEVFTAAIVVSSAPVPQTLQILDNGNVELDDHVRPQLEAIVYERCIAALVACTSPCDVRSIQHPDVAYVGDNFDKGISPLPSYTIHGTPEFSERMWDADRSAVATHLARCAFGEALEGVTVVDVHGWKFSRPLTTSPTTFVQALVHPSLILIGDAFGGPRVEGAIISALDASVSMNVFSSTNLNGHRILQ